MPIVLTMNSWKTHTGPADARADRPPAARLILRSRLVQAGAVLLVLGTGPLVAIIILDPKSNPIGPGLLAFFTFWPSIGLVALGVVRALVCARRA